MSDINTICLYARVSTDMQSSGLDAQLRALRQFCIGRGIEKYQIFADENQSGAKSSRPQLDLMMEQVRAGKVERVIVYSLSRLGRSTTHLLKCMDEMNKYGCKFVSLSEHLETETPAGRMIFTILAAVSQLERELIVERVKCGLAAAKARGKQIGRKKLRNSTLIRQLLKNGLSFRQVAKIAGVSHGSISAEKKDMLRDETMERKKLEESLRASAAEQKKEVEGGLPSISDSSVTTP